MKIIIIDGNSLINRAYYAMQRPMITKTGLYTQGVYGFLNMLNKIKNEYKPDYLTVAFDSKAQPSDIRICRLQSRKEKNAS